VSTIPQIPAVRDDNLLEVARKLKMWVEYASRGDGAMVRQSQLEGLTAQLTQVAQAAAAAAGGTGGGTDLVPDTPPTPTNLAAQGAMFGVVVSWQSEPYAKHAHYELWRSSTPARGDAVPLAAPTAAIWYDSDVTPGQTWYYWVRARSTSGLFSPYNQLAGVSAQVETSPADLLTLLNQQITNSQLAAELSAPIALITAPATTAGSVAARIKAETDARIAAVSGVQDDVDGAVDRIADLETTVDGPAGVVATAQALDQVETIVNHGTSGNVALATRAQALEATVNNATTGLPATRALLLSDYKTEAETDQAIAQARDALSAQISSGAVEMFAAARAWQFTTGLDGWAGYEGNVFYGTWAQAVGLAVGTASSNGDIILEKTLAASEQSTGAGMPVVRVRLKRPASGSTTWAGFLFYKTASHGHTWSNYAHTPEPTWDAQGWGIAEWAPGGVNAPDWATDTITNLRFDISRGGPAGAQWQVDWVAGGAMQVPASGADLLTERTARVSADEALSQSVTTLSARLNAGGDVAQSISAAVQAASNAQAAADGKASASSVTTLQAQVAGTQGSALLSQIEQTASTSAQVDGHLANLYTVRVSTTQGGRQVVGGFGISGTAEPNAGATIDFGVQADKFWIGAPTGSTGVADVRPFVVQTGDETDLATGVLIPKGVYMDAAYIKNLSVLYARFGTLVADSISAASISAAQLTVGDGTVGGDLKSAGYTFGSVGWRLTSGGSLFAHSGFIGGVAIAAGALRSGQTALDTGTGFWLGGDGKFSVGNGTTRKIAFDGTNITIKTPGLTIENGSATFSGDIEAGSVIKAGVELQAPSGTIGVITAGKLQQQGNEHTYVNLDATGTQAFLQVWPESASSPRVRINADGSAKFSKNLASGIYSWGSGQVGPRVMARVPFHVYSDNFGYYNAPIPFTNGQHIEQFMGNEQLCLVGGYAYIDTGLTIPYSAIDSQTYIARALIYTTQVYADYGSVSNGAQLAKFDVVADVVFHNFQYAGYYPSNAEPQKIYVRVYIKPWWSAYGAATREIFINSIQWALDLVP
jgi:Domain of unknown function (DUF1983)